MSVPFPERTFKQQRMISCWYQDHLVFISERAHPQHRETIKDLSFCNEMILLIEVTIKSGAIKFYYKSVRLAF